MISSHGSSILILKVKLIKLHGIGNFNQNPMIARIWHGYTSPENAGVYENLLKTEVFPSIENKKVMGYKKISLLKRELDTEVEFITIMLFENLQSVKDFAGEDYEKSHVPEKPRKILTHFDEKAQHYEIINEISY